MEAVMEPVSWGRVRTEREEALHRPRRLCCYHGESILSPVRIPKPPDASHIFNFYFSSKSILLPFFFFLLAATRDLLIVIHLYLCLRLTALIWSLPHFQVRVIMFSAPGSTPQPPCEQRMG